MSNFLLTVIFGICLISRVPRHDDKLMANPETESPYKITHKIQKFSTKIDDLGIIIIRKRCSIQQREKSYVDQGKVLKIDCSVF